MSSASYAVRLIKYSLPIETLKIINFVHIHSIMSYGIIFWGNSPSAKKIFLLQKQIIRIITNTRRRDSFQEHANIDTVFPIYILNNIIYS